MPGSPSLVGRKPGIVKKACDRKVSRVQIPLPALISEGFTNNYIYVIFGFIEDLERVVQSNITHGHGNIEVNNKKIILITNAQRPYIQKILIKLSEVNPENARLICDYILSEQISFNIKESIKEGKIKILVWLSEFLGNKLFINTDRPEILSLLTKL